MNLDLQGCLNFNEFTPIDFIIHKDRCMTDWEARTLINYGIENGKKYLSEIPDEVADAICEIGNDTYKKYEPKEVLHFVAQEYVEEVIKRVLGWHIDCESDREEIFDDIMNAL